jgi:tetratricopeptide (TPR) repeat protein
MDEDLVEAYDNFVIGNFKQCLDMASRARPSNDFSRFLWESLTARSHLGLGHMDKIRELSKSSNPALQGTAFFAVFQRSQVDTQRKNAFDKVVDNANHSNGEPVSCYYSCTARAIGGDLIDAINYAKAVAASSPSEFNALRAQFSLAINRPDLADRILSESAANRDDSAAAKLVAAIHALVTGKTNEACMCYSDLIAQFTAEGSLTLANGRAVGNIQRGLYAEAREDLENASSVKADDVDTIRNMICCLTWEGKRDEAREWLGRLAGVAPNHRLIQECGRLKDAFTNFA